MFNPNPIEIILPAQDWTCDKKDYTDNTLIREYHFNKGYKLIQGNGIVQGRLIGGQTGMKDTIGTSIELKADDFKDKILFVEDIVEYDYHNSMLSVINGQYGMNNLPIHADMNFGHTSPIFYTTIWSISRNQL